MISIVVPTHNRARLLPRAITSIQNQSFADWELIVVDDGSTDDTQAIIEPFLRDSRVRFHFKKNSGAAHSRNVGVELAAGNIITFLDSDDEALPNWLERMSSAMGNDTGVVCCGLERYDETGKFIDALKPESMAPFFSDTVGRFTNGGVFMMRREVFLAIGGFDPELESSQHTEMSFRLIPYLRKHNLSIVNLMEPLIRIHIHSGPRIRFNNVALYLGTARIVRKHKELFKMLPKQHIDFLAMAGVAAVRAKRYREASVQFREAIAVSPSNPGSWGRWIISFIPGVRDIIWRKSSK
jgi:glycosyltransferase involved in cell wall biosynthesis